MVRDAFFHRPELARRLAGLIMTDAVGSAVSSGLFLSAPRRTGKSTFMREDLRPALVQAGALVLYVDLWADKKADPGDVIVSAVRVELARHEGVVAKLARSAGVDKVTVGGMVFSLDKIGLGQPVSLSAALAQLSDDTRKTIVLIIDEAQHAITSENGYDALFALKAARDELNSSQHHGLRIVATGSNSDKLAMLRNSKEQAFFGAPLHPFPALDGAFVKWFCQNVGLQGPLDPESVAPLFDRAARRPEILAAAADQVRFDFTAEAADTAARFAQAVEAQIAAADQQTLRVVRSLTPLQTAVLCVLAKQGQAYAPFQEQTLALYRAALEATAPGQKAQLDVSGVQSALQALQDKSLVWRERRGVYALEDSSLADLLQRQGWLRAVPGTGQAAEGASA